MTDIRHASEHDLDGIMTICSIYGYNNPPDFHLQQISHWEILVAVEGLDILWYLLYQIIWWNTPFLALLQIHPDYKQQGLGTELLAAFEKKLFGLGFTSYISSTEPSNTWSLIFHEKKWCKDIGTLDMSHGKEVFFRKEIG